MFIVKRDDNNPILKPIKEHPWESAATFSWSLVREGKKVHYFYRSMSEPDQIIGSHTSISSISYANTTNGLDIKDREQVIFPDTDFDKFGCEDPRISFFEGKYYIFYTALGGYPFSADNIKVAVAIGDKPTVIKEKHLVTPFNAKAMTLFPERINGKIVVAFTYSTDKPPSHIAFAELDNIEELWDPKYWAKWQENKEVNLIDLRRFPSDQVEVGAAPIKTDRGWLLIYSHIQDYFTPKPVLGVEAALLDINNPKMIIGKTPGPFLVPEEVYEKYGMVPNIVFPTDAELEGKDTLVVYYSAADTTGCRASLSLSSLLKTLDPKERTKETVRYAGNPILLPKEENAWEAFAVFNPASIEIDGDIYILYRAMSKDNTSTVGMAVSKDGFTLTERLKDPIYIPREDFEMKKGSPTGNSGCEDPRIVQIDDTLYMTYTAYDGVHPPRVAMTTIKVKDFLNRKWDKWTKPNIVSPDGVDDKDACLLPEKLHGRYYIFHRIGNHICVDYVSDPTFAKEKANRCIQIVSPRVGMWDSAKVGISGQPIKTDKGWILFYHGVSKTSTYRMGAVLLDLDDPTTVLARTTGPVFEPKEDYEMEGVVNKVVFPCGEILRDGNIYIYYGGADKVVGVATISLKDMLSALS
ncbi:hypothetical protein H6790_00115 [Candidatus Nomurabacteria bacterium]|nr:hypothetical protein [Candidatus Nomurabacteria bacterium]MCB9820341.1 hypothetical protein [Candidatus Nomurabacteria bacterium]